VVVGWVLVSGGWVDLTSWDCFNFIATRPPLESELSSFEKQATWRLVERTCKKVESLETYTLTKPPLAQAAVPRQI
jgi:hypothetical protein